VLSWGFGRVDCLRCLRFYLQPAITFEAKLSFLNNASYFFILDRSYKISRYFFVMISKS